MLFEVIAIILALYACLTPAIILKSVKFGMSAAQTPKEAIEKPIFTVKKKKTPDVPPEIQKGLDIIANIDNYDGTSTGQKEIK